MLPIILEREIEIKKLQKNSIKFWIYQYICQQGFHQIYNGIVLEQKKVIINFLKK